MPPQAGLKGPFIPLICPNDTQQLLLQTSGRPQNRVSHPIPDQVRRHGDGWGSIVGWEPKG